MDRTTDGGTNREPRKDARVDRAQDHKPRNASWGLPRPRPRPRPPFPSLTFRPDENLTWATRTLGSWARDRFLVSPVSERFTRDLAMITGFWVRWVDLATPTSPLSAVLVHLALVTATESKCWKLWRVAREARTFPDWVWYYERWAFADAFHVVLPDRHKAARVFIRAYLPDAITSINDYRNDPL